MSIDHTTANAPKHALKNVPRWTLPYRCLHKHIIRITGLFFTLFLALIVGQGCTRRETPVERGIREGTLHFGNLSEPASLDPHVVTGISEHNVISSLLEGLVGEHPKTLEPVPGVARDWHISEDGTTFTFYLNPDAQWSNGDPVTADDFVFSWQRILTPSLGAPYAYMLYAIDQAQAFHRGDIDRFEDVGIKAVDQHTLKVHLHTPMPYFLSLLAHTAWLPVHPATVLAHGTIGEPGTAWATVGHYIGNGPFVLAAWQPHQYIRVRKSETYWDSDQVTLNAIVFHPIGDHSIEERAFRAGQLHITGTVPAERIAFYRRHNPDVLRLEPYLGCYYYLFNTRRPPLDNPNVRKALALAIQRQRITRHITRGGEQPAYHFTPPDTGGFTSRHALEGTPDDARRLLAKAGYPNGEGFPELTVLYNTADTHARIAEAIQQMWKEQLNINVTLVNMEWKVYLEQTRNGHYDIARAGWIADYLDPNTFLDLWVTDGGNNRTGWSHAAYDQLINQASRTANQEKRFSLFQEAERLLSEEAPIMPIYFYQSKSLVHPSVQGWYANVLDRHPWKHLSLAVQKTE